MPNYDYKCPKCVGYWREERTMLERHDATCPRCGGPGVIVFKSVPGFSWFPGTTRSPYKEKRRNH